MQAPLISTTLLNWNRADLLERTLNSYVQTVSVPYELFIVDNGSKDGSREIIDRFCRKHVTTTPILLDSNEGGRAINLGLERSRGQFLHISENDLEYFPSWANVVMADFEAFPQLGQLSVFGTAPADDELSIGSARGILNHCCGNIVYVTDENVGTSSILRRAVWDRGVRIHNLPTTGRFLFPDDGRLSADVRSLGLWPAWAHKHLVRNWGHLYSEIEARPEYYLENYRSKSWVGVDGFCDRISLWSAQPRPIRKSFLYGDEPLQKERSFPTEECRFPQRWSMIDGNTAEVETLEFLYSLTRLVKPELVVETGTWHGHSAAAFGKALRQNGFGKLVTFEIDSEVCGIAKQRVELEGLSAIVEIRNHSSMQGTLDHEIGILLLDSELSLRADEFRYFRDRLKPGAIVLFHDTNTLHKVVRADVQTLVQEGLLISINMATPRGLAICQYAGPGSEGST